MAFCASAGRLLHDYRNATAPECSPDSTVSLRVSLVGKRYLEDNRGTRRTEKAVRGLPLGDTMSFFDDIKAQVESLDIDSLKGKLTDLTDGLDLASLQAKFEESGLQDKVNSWVSTAESNIAISAEEIKATLGPKIVDLAQKAGVSVEEAAQKIADTLPGLIDKITPEVDDEV